MKTAAFLSEFANETLVQQDKALTGACLLHGGDQLIQISGIRV